MQSVVYTTFRRSLWVGVNESTLLRFLKYEKFELGFEIWEKHIGGEDVRVWKKTQRSGCCRHLQMPINTKIGLFSWGELRRSSWRNLEIYQDLLCAILNSSLRCFDLMGSIQIRCIACSKQYLERSICLKKMISIKEKLEQEDLWRLCFIERTWNGMSLIGQ